jgi:hypothetical protein
MVNIQNYQNSFLGIRIGNSNSWQYLVAGAITDDTTSSNFVTFLGALSCGINGVIRKYNRYIGPSVVLTSSQCQSSSCFITLGISTSSICLIDSSTVCPKGTFLLASVYECYNCSSACAACPTFDYCTVCLPGYYLYENHRCYNSCYAPYTMTNDSENTYCTFPCSYSEYYYANGSCLATCEYPFNPHQDFADHKFCNFPCSDTNLFYYANTSCLTVCQNSPEYTSKTENIYKFCDLSCGDLYYYLNGSCLNNCTSPFIQRMVGNAKYCDFPCSLGLGLYPNGTCRTCKSPPFVMRMENIYTHCEDNPCKITVNVSRKYYDDGYCFSKFLSC